MSGFLTFVLNNVITLNKLEFMMVLLPIVFMLHDFEEIIMFRLWLKRNRSELRWRFARFEALLDKHRVFDYSTATFSVAIAHEFLLITLVCYLAIYLQKPQWWFMGFMGFFVHLLIHIAQWLIYGKYIPAILTSFLALPYCFYSLYLFINANLLTPSQLVLWTITGSVLTMLSLPFAFFWAGIFYRHTQSS